MTKRFDVADAAAVDAAIKEIVAAEGGLHILVNNAGIAVNALILGAKDADWKRAHRRQPERHVPLHAGRRCAR